MAKCVTNITCIAQVTFKFARHCQKIEGDLKMREAKPPLVIVLNIFLHFTHMYANSLTLFYVLENDRRSVETSFFIRDFYCVK